jgi:hypothetical protein
VIALRQNRKPPRGWYGRVSAVRGTLQVSVADLLGQPGDPTDPLKAGAVAPTA